MNKDKLMKRLADIKKTSGGSKHLFKPQPGTTRIRIVPYKFDKDDPIIDVYFHYGFGNPPLNYLSPLT